MRRTTTLPTKGCPFTRRNLNARAKVFNRDEEEGQEDYEETLASSEPRHHTMT
jgi:hypothetical protein